MPCFPTLGRPARAGRRRGGRDPRRGRAGGRGAGGRDRLRRRRRLRRRLRRDRGRARSWSASWPRRPPGTSCRCAGPNGNGIVALHERAALWGDALRPLEPGRVALVSQSGNVAVNTLATRRGLRLHTVVSCGNAVGLDPAEWVAALAEEDEVGSIARLPGGRRRRRAALRGARPLRRARRGRGRAEGGRLGRGRGGGRGAHGRRGGRPARVPRARGGGRRGLGRGRARAARAGQGAGRAGCAPGAATAGWRC